MVRGLGNKKESFNYKNTWAHKNNLVFFFFFFQPPCYLYLSVLVVWYPLLLFKALDLLKLILAIQVSAELILLFGHPIFYGLSGAAPWLLWIPTSHSLRLWAPSFCCSLTAFYVPTSNVCKFQFLYSLTNTWFSAFLIIAILVAVMWHLIVVFICIFLMTNVPF